MNPSVNVLANGTQSIICGSITSQTATEQTRERKGYGQRQGTAQIVQICYCLLYDSGGWWRWRWWKQLVVRDRWKWLVHMDRRRVCCRKVIWATLPVTPSPCMWSSKILQVVLFLYNRNIKKTSKLRLCLMTCYGDECVSRFTIKHHGCPLRTRSALRLYPWWSSCTELVRGLFLLCFLSFNVVS